MTRKNLDQFYTNKRTKKSIKRKEKTGFIKFMKRQGLAIRSVRTILGQNQEEFSKLIGVSKKTLSYIETGKSKISTRQIQQLIVYGISRGYNFKPHLGIK